MFRRQRLGMFFATLRRDALLTWSYPFAFVARWFTLPISLASSYFLSHLVGGTAHFGHSSEYFTYVCINLTFLTLASAVLQNVATTVRFDQYSGTLEPIIASGVSPVLYVSSTIIWPLCVAVAQVALAVLFACALLGLSLYHCNVLSLIVIVALGLGAMSAIGIASAAAVIAFKQMPPSNYLVGGAATFFSGALFPIELFPEPLRMISWLLPLTHAMRGLRGAVAGLSLAKLAPDALWLGCVTVVALPMACFAVHCAVRRSIADGSLNSY